MKTYPVYYRDRLGRRKRPPAGIPRAPRRRFPQHLKWVRGFDCAAGKSGGCSVRMEAAHVQASDAVPYKERGGRGIKPHDKWALPMCSLHHRESHDIGHDRFDREHGIDRAAIALQLQKRSPYRKQWEEE